MSTGPTKIRVNGFQCPSSRDQIKTLTTYPLIVICYYLILSVTLRWDDDRLPVLLSINSVLSVLLFSAWVTVEYIDPELKPGKTGIPVICFTAPEKSARFCGTCRKTVSGLDHHCTWLNTCIGRRNYFSFISLVFIGATQSVLQTAIGFITLIVWVNDYETQTRISLLFSGKLWAFYLAVSIYTAIAGLISVGLLLLAAFHTYLMLYVRMGTYDWLLHRRGSAYDASVQDDERDPELSGKERKKQAEREEWQRIINHPRKKTVTTDKDPGINAFTKSEERICHNETKKGTGSFAGLENIHLKGGHRRSSRECELGIFHSQSTSVGNMDVLNEPLKAKVLRKSFCVQKENSSGSSFRMNNPLSSSDRLRQSGTFIESSSCHDPPPEPEVSYEVAMKQVPVDSDIETGKRYLESEDNSLTRETTT